MNFFKYYEPWATWRGANQINQVWYDYGNELASQNTKEVILCPECRSEMWQDGENDYEVLYCCTRQHEVIVRKQWAI